MKHMLKGEQLLLAVESDTKANTLPSHLKIKPRSSRTFQLSQLHADRQSTRLGRTCLQKRMIPTEIEGQGCSPSPSLSLSPLWAFVSRRCDVPMHSKGFFQRREPVLCSWDRKEGIKRGLENRDLAGTVSD